MLIFVFAADFRLDVFFAGAFLVREFVLDDDFAALFFGAGFRLTVALADFRFKVRPFAWSSTS